MSSGQPVECCEPLIANGVSSRIVQVLTNDDVPKECCIPCQPRQGKQQISSTDPGVPTEPLPALIFWQKDVLAAMVCGDPAEDAGRTPKSRKPAVLPSSCFASSAPECCMPDMASNKTSLEHASGEHNEEEFCWNGENITTLRVDRYELVYFPLDAPTSWHAWLEWLGGYPAWFKIEAYTEFCQLSPVSQFVRGRHLESAYQSVFTILETCSTGDTDNTRRALCIEKFADQLEIMVSKRGEPTSSLIAYAKRFRATGASREVHAWRPLKERSRCQVGPAAGMPEITILDLLRWMNGPVARQWAPFDRFQANSTHFAQELHLFFSEGCAEHDSLSREVVLASVKEDGMNLQLASETMRADEAVVLAAVGRDGSALQYAAKKLQASREIVLVAVAKDGMSLRFAAKELQGDREIVAAAVRSAGRALLFASPELQADNKLALAAVRQDPWAMQFVAESLRGNRKTMLEVVSVHGTALRYASDSLRADREVVLAAVKQDRKALRLASPALQKDKALFALANPPEESVELERYKPKYVKEKKEKKKEGDSPKARSSRMYRDDNNEPVAPSKVEYEAHW